MAALSEEMLRMSLLKISAADFPARNLSCDRKDGNAAPMTIVETVNQVQVPWAAASGTHGQFASEMCLSAGGERRHFLMSYVYPLNSPACAKRVRDTVQGVAGNSVHPLNSSFRKNVNQQLSYFFGHGTPLLV